MSRRTNDDVIRHAAAMRRRHAPQLGPDSMQSLDGADDVQLLLVPAAAACEVVARSYTVASRGRSHQVRRLCCVWCAVLA